MTILLIEDDLEIADEILAGLRREGYQARHAATGPEGLAAVREAPPDLVIVDRTLPGIDGLTIIDTLHREGVTVPFLVLSALSSADERIRGLKAGGDDYLGKPFVMGELFARIEALLRRPTDIRETSLTLGPLEIDLIERTARRGTREIDLLPRLLVTSGKRCTRARSAVRIVAAPCGPSGTEERSSPKVAVVTPAKTTPAKLPSGALMRRARTMTGFWLMRETSGPSTPTPAALSRARMK